MLDFIITGFAYLAVLIGLVLGLWTMASIIGTVGSFVVVKTMELILKIKPRSVKIRDLYRRK